MSGHTPGPWVVRERGLGYGVETQMGTTVATCWRFNRGIADATPSMEEANARLIAAAPDLLEALERLVELGFSDRLYSDEEDVAWENVEKVIQKARGEGESG